MKKLLISALATSALIFLPSSAAYAAGTPEARISQLEKQVASLQAEVESLKALEKQDLFLRECVNQEKSTNSIKVSMKLASCTVSYFKTSRANEQKKITK